MEKMKQLLGISETKPSVDFTYLLKMGNRSIYKIPTCFEQSEHKPGDKFSCRISQVYDVSKFWFVIKHKELELFQKYLFKFYYLNQNTYKVPIEKLEYNMYCVCFTDSAYFRGVIIGVPNIICGRKKVQILYFDYGMVGSVDIDQIYFMEENCFYVPQFALRGSLFGVAPLTSKTWTSENVCTFSDLSNDKIVYGQIINIKSKFQVLDVQLGFLGPENDVIMIHEKLVELKQARFYHQDEEFRPNTSKFQPYFEYLYCFPLHESVETGRTPSTVTDAEFQLTIQPFGLIASSYYIRNEIKRGQEISESYIQNGLNEHP